MTFSRRRYGDHGIFNFRFAIFNRQSKIGTGSGRFFTVSVSDDLLHSQRRFY
jgi:hypothetical protein